MSVSYLRTRVDEHTPEGCVTSAHLIHAAGITYQQLGYWTRTGLLHHTPRPVGNADVFSGQAGPGYPRYYPSTQVARAATIQLLLDGGIALRTIRTVIDELLEVGHVRLNGALTIHLPIDP